MAGRGDTGSSGFGERLKVVRENKGLTQKQLGEVADVHPNTIAKLERGDQEPNWPLVLKLAKALEADCTAFAEGGEPKVDDPEPSKPAAKKPAAKKGKK